MQATLITSEGYAKSVESALVELWFRRAPLNGSELCACLQRPKTMVKRTNTRKGVVWSNLHNAAFMEFTSSCLSTCYIRFKLRLHEFKMLPHFLPTTKRLQ